MNIENTKHIIITRLGLKGKFIETGLSWDEWLLNSIYLMDKFCRPSLKNQTNQNFTLLSRIDDSVNYFGDVLDNEIIVKQKNFSNTLNNIIGDSQYIILTRLDRDDALRFDFIDNLQKDIVHTLGNRYYDIKNLISYNSLNNELFLSKKYNHMISPFVSTIEKVENGKIPLIPLKNQHTNINKVIDGCKIDNLYAMQIIHEYNLLNKITGELNTEINLLDYGIKI